MSEPVVDVEKVMAELREAMRPYLRVGSFSTESMVQQIQASLPSGYRITDWSLKDGVLVLQVMPPLDHIKVSFTIDGDGKINKS